MNADNYFNWFMRSTNLDYLMALKKRDPLRFTLLNASKEKKRSFNWKYAGAIFFSDMRSTAFLQFEYQSERQI